LRVSDQEQQGATDLWRYANSVDEGRPFLTALRNNLGHQAQLVRGSGNERRCSTVRTLWRGSNKQFLSGCQPTHLIQQRDQNFTPILHIAKPPEPNASGNDLCKCVGEAAG